MYQESIATAVSFFVTQIGITVLVDWLSQHLLLPLWPPFATQLWSVSYATATKVRTYILVKWHSHLLKIH